MTKLLNDCTSLCVIFLCIAVMSVMLSHHSGPVVVSAASNSHIVHYLAAEKINFKVHVHHIICM